MANQISTHPDLPHRSSGKAIIRLFITLALFGAVLYFMLNAWGAWKHWQLIG